MDAQRVTLWIALILIVGIGLIELVNSERRAPISLSSTYTPSFPTTFSPTVPPSVATPSEALDVPTDSRWPTPGGNWINSLRVKMVPAGTDGVLFSIYDVRLEDFQKFAKETNLPLSSEHMHTYKVLPHPNGDGGASVDFAPDSSLSWKDPGFYQNPTEPVVGISWNETQLFCQWLTDKERAAGLIGPAQRYRLPKIAEWNRAAGDTTYPWGNTWPPTADAGNYCDESWAASTRRSWYVLESNDGYAFTSPVGSFPPNQFGLYDMGGNVCQFTEEPDPRIDVHKLWRGSSWSEFTTDQLRLDCTRYSCGPTYRYTTLGFRVVLETK